MPTKFTELLNLPTILSEMGYQVRVAEGFQYGQCTWKGVSEKYPDGYDHYVWKSPYTGSKSHDLPPYGYMVHHTGSSSANPPAASNSKAGAWIGLERNGNLYQSGGGVPTIYLATAGPARISSGYGYRPAAWENTFEDKRAPWKAKGPDGDTALNRYVFNVETVCAGVGSALDPDVWDCVVGLGVALHEMFGWKERTLGHDSWSTRKPDPEWSVGLPNDGEQSIIDVQDEIALRAGGNVATMYRIGDENQNYEEVSWMLGVGNGLDINPNANSSQIQSALPWKTNVRAVQEQDFDTLADIIGLNSISLDRLKADGLYSLGKEMAALRDKLYRTS